LMMNIKPTKDSYMVKKRNQRRSFLNIYRWDEYSWA
jgi:hypothetical protein